MKFPTIKPDVNTLELTFFGKGYGESTLVHVFNYKYILVDSFINNETHNPVSLDYLEAIGLSANNIIGIICTHWDDDHIKGINAVIESCHNKIDVYTPIVLDEKILSYMLADKETIGSKANEFCSLLDKLGNQKINLKYANTDKALFVHQSRYQNKYADIVALSPTDEQYREFLNSIILPQSGKPKMPSSIDSNKISVVVYLNMIIEQILLGADMENSSVGGWDVISDDFNYGEKCHIFKIPHHGSSTGFNEKVWSKLVDKPISIITRFNSAGLPTDEYKNKILSHSSSLYVLGGKPKKDKILAQSIKKLCIADSQARILDSGVGYVNLRRYSIDSDWEIQYGGQVEYFKNSD